MNDPQKDRYNYEKHIKPLSSVMESMLKRMGLYSGLMEAKIDDAWETIAGHAARQYTAEIRIINNRLYVKILSSALRQELIMNKDHILEKIKQLFNLKLEDIVIY